MGSYSNHFVPLVRPCVGLGNGSNSGLYPEYDFDRYNRCVTANIGMMHATGSSVQGCNKSAVKTPMSELSCDIAATSVNLQQNQPVKPTTHPMKTSDYVEDGRRNSFACVLLLMTSTK